MTRHIIQTSDAPSSPLYSQAINAGSTVYVWGSQSNRHVKRRDVRLARPVAPVERRELSSLRSALPALRWVARRNTMFPID